MNLFWTLLLAIIQGLTEFLPVSSSAHLTILGALAGFSEEDALVLFLVLHMGTLLATVLFFWKDLWGLLVGLVHLDRPSMRYVLLIVLATIPTGIIGLLLKGIVEKAFTSPAVAGGLLLVTGAVLVGTKFLRRGEKPDCDISVSDALLIGIAQGIAVFPGISRSGATLSASLARGLSSEAAFRFSFLVSLPAILGAFLLEARQAFSSENPHLVDDSLGLAVSLGVGLLALFLLKRFVVRGRLHWFSIWCAITGLLGLATAYYLNR